MHHGIIETTEQSACMNGASDSQGKKGTKPCQHYCHPRETESIHKAVPPSSEAGVAMGVKQTRLK